ncbi:MAG: hypothetical protein JW982_09680 [Spirochaetes bacterium]|nr:hypothetical protein [Spirochaetota bacterium]
MSIRPIDLQSNIGQISEIARNQNAKNDAVIQQHTLADQEAALKSSLINTRLGENKKADESQIRDEEKKRKNPFLQSSGNKDEEESDDKEVSSNVKYVQDLGLGRIIDIKK